MAYRKEFDLELAHQLQAQGLTCKQIGQQMGHTFTTIKMHLDPFYAAMRKQRTNELRRMARYKEGNTTTTYRVTPADLEQLFQEVPRDTRSRTARLCGDPVSYTI
jgi:hypothetical protein